MSYQPVPLPGQLPSRLAITLWDFSWYVRTGPGEPFEDLDRAFTEAVERGDNTIRICSMPYLLFGSGLDTTAVRHGPLSGGYGQGLRWYDVEQTTTIDAEAQLVALFEAASRHDCFVILSSWEYQQSSSFSLDPGWWDALLGIDPEDRAEAQAVALADLVDFLIARGLDDQTAFTEIHNEVQLGLLADGLREADVDLVVALEPRLSRGLAAFHARHPGRPVTVNYAGVPVGSMRGVPETIDVLVTHPSLRLRGVGRVQRGLRRGLDRLHPEERPLRGRAGGRRVLPPSRCRIDPGRSLGHPRLFQRRTSARHVG